MTTLAIDTLATMRKLEKAGFDTEQAEAVAVAVAEVVGRQGEDLATKADITGVRQDITRVEQGLSGLERSLRAEMATMRWMMGIQSAFLLAVALRVFKVL